MEICYTCKKYSKQLLKLWKKKEGERLYSDENDTCG